MPNGIYGILSLFSGGERDRGGDEWTLLQARQLTDVYTSCANKFAKSFKNTRASTSVSSVNRLFRDFELYISTRFRKILALFLLNESFFQLQTK